MYYRDKNLRRLFAALSPANRKKAIKGACRRVANSVKKVAINNLRSTGLHNAEQLSEGVRAMAFKREAGFRVTVAAKKANMLGRGEKGMHKNRVGEKKPILIWAELGTKWRRTKADKKYKVSIEGRWRTIGKHRGFMKRYGFMAKTRNQVNGSVGHKIKEEIAAKIKQISRKYGCS